MDSNNQNHENNMKQLPDVFKELKEAQKRQALENLQYTTQKHIPKNKQSRSKKQFQDTYTKSTPTMRLADHKFNAIGAIIGILFVILFIMTVKSNYIFATSKEEEKQPIGDFEANENPMNIMNYISDNISEVVRKEISTENITIQHETEYIENNQLPKDEEVTIEEGLDGYKEVTYIRSFESEVLVDEKIINENVVEEPKTAVIQVGTSEFLSDYQVHIGDIMYTIEKIPLMEEPSDTANMITNIYENIDVTLLTVDDGWCKVIVDGIEGYVSQDKLTSEAINPEMPEKSRIKRIMLTLNFDMELNKPSGLTRADFTKVLSGNVNDVDSIFENNAGLFFDIEQKYNINGIFLASIGIHESNWGMSNIAKAKKNLFGYGAYDASPFASSYSFESYEYGIELLAKVLVKHYLNEAGTPIYDEDVATGNYYNGPTVSGVNVRYASDPNWKNRVFEIMTNLYEKLENE